MKKIKLISSIVVTSILATSIVLAATLPLATSGAPLTKTIWDNIINQVNQNSTDLGNIYTKNEIDGKGYITNHQDINRKTDKNEVYTKSEIDALLSGISSSTGWPEGSYCILRAGGSYPSGFTSGNGYMRAISGYSANSTYLRPYTFGDSKIKYHGNGSRLDLYITACCK